MTAGLPVGTFIILQLRSTHEESFWPHLRYLAPSAPRGSKRLQERLNISLCESMSGTRAPTRDGLARSHGHAGHIQRFREDSHVLFNFTLIYSGPQIKGVGAFGRNLLKRKQK
jgi:hypothetical protein